MRAMIGKMGTAVGLTNVELGLQLAFRFFAEPR